MWAIVRVLSHIIHTHQYTHLAVPLHCAFLSKRINLCQNISDIWKLFDMTLLLSYQNVIIPSCCLVVGKKFDAFRLHIIMTSVFLSGKNVFLLFFLSLPLREKCPNTEFLLVRIWTPFTTCTLWILTSEIFLFHREIRKLGTTSVIKREREREKERERGREMRACAVFW